MAGKKYITERNGRSFWERQGIVAFCTCQWDECIITGHEDTDGGKINSGVVTISHGRSAAMKGTRYLFYRRLDVPRTRSGRLRKILRRRGIHRRTDQPVEKSLYRLSSPGRLQNMWISELCFIFRKKKSICILTTSE